MNERELVRWLERNAPRFGTELKLGIGDDCAVYRPKAGQELLLTTDFTIEDRHFTLAYSTVEDAGWKALARGLSDVAAMGGTARFVLVSLAVPNADVARKFFRGLFRLARRFEVSLAGGDLSHSEKILCDVTVGGVVRQGRAVQRSTARVGDRISVSGPLGTWKKKPLPRLDLSALVARRASAAMDITDGLAMDLDRLLVASGVTAEITAPPPVMRGATLEQAWHHGEDYELLVTSAKPMPPPFVEIGVVVAGKPGSPVPPVGWDYFR